MIVCFLPLGLQVRPNFVQGTPCLSPKARQSKTLRSLSDTIPFEIAHMTGACHQPERLSMFAIGRTKGYCQLGIEVGWGKMDIFEDHARVAVAGDLCSTLSELSIAITNELVRRNLSFTDALPRRQTLLCSPEHAQGFVDELRKDYDIWNRIQEMGFEGKGSMVARSVFQLTSVKQLVGLLKIEGWTATARQSAFLPCSTASKVVEVSVCLGLLLLLHIGPVPSSNPKFGHTDM